VAAPINIEVYSDALVVLGTAGIVVPMVRRFGLSPVLGYLAAGAILGPLGLGSLIKQFPFLYWFTSSTPGTSPASPNSASSSCSSSSAWSCPLSA